MSDKLPQEGEQFALIPVDIDNTQAWHVRVLEGEFAETVLAFGNIGLSLEKDSLTFNFDVVYSPDESATCDNEDLQILAGDIISSILDRSITDQTAVLTDQEGQQIEY